MLKNDLQRIVLRSMVGLLTEYGLNIVDSTALVSGLLKADLALQRADLHYEIGKLVASDILQNGEGQNLRLTSIGLLLGMGITLPSEVDQRLAASFSSCFENSREL